MTPSLRDVISGWIDITSLSVEAKILVADRITQALTAAGWVNRDDVVRQATSDGSIRRAITALHAFCDYEEDPESGMRTAILAALSYREAQ